MFYPSKILTASRLPHYRNPERALRGAIRMPGGVTLPAGQIMYETVAAANCVQSLALGGTITGGSFNILFVSQAGYDSLGPIAYSATVATLKANIQAALDNYFGPSQCVVSGSGSPYTLTFSGNLVSDLDIPTPNVINNLTGTSPTVAITQTTQGSGGIGFYEPYVAGSGNGSTYCILEFNTRTAANGNIIDEHGDSGKQTIDALFSGEYLASLITGADTTLFPSSGAFGTMGKFRSGGWNTYPALYPGSVLYIPGF